VTNPDLFGATACRLCQHWTGDEQHVVQQVPALCRQRTRLHAHPRTYADDTCGQFRASAENGRAA